MSATASAPPAILAPSQPGRWVAGAVALLFVAWVVFQLLTNPGFEWGVVAQYLFSPEVLRGVATTVELTVVVMAAGIVLGAGLALARLAANPVLPACARAFIWFFRGVPVLVQLVFWYNLAALFPVLSLGVPFGGPKLVSVSSTAAISSFTAALLGLGLNEAAYMAEIVRAGLLSVDRGQVDASRALGHRPGQTLRIVVLPQAMRAIVPPTGNQVIGMLKYTSIASVVALPELMQSVENIYSRNFETVPLLIVAALWYLALVGVLSVGQGLIERRFARGAAGEDRAA